MILLLLINGMNSIIIISSVPDTDLYQHKDYAEQSGWHEFNYEELPLVPVIANERIDI